MEIEQNQVKEFLVNAGQEISDRPKMPSKAVRISRLRWLAEELCELANAWGVEFDLNNVGGAVDNFYAKSVENPMFTDDFKALVEAYDASLDLIVFAMGNGVAMGTALQPGWDEVYRSNMSKFTDGHRREDGKWVKGPSYSPARLAEIIQRQIDAAAAKDKQLLLESQP